MLGNPTVFLTLKNTEQGQLKLNMTSRHMNLSLPLYAQKYHAIPLHTFIVEANQKQQNTYVRKTEQNREILPVFEKPTQRYHPTHLTVEIH